MDRHLRRVPTVLGLLLGALALTTLGAPVALGDSDPATCRVRNVTQGTAGRSFAAMVAAAVVRG